MISQDLEQLRLNTKKIATSISWERQEPKIKSVYKNLLNSLNKT